MRSSSLWRRTPDEPAGSFWDKRAKRFNESLMQNRERAERQIAKIVLNPAYTVLDVGSGNIFKKRYRKIAPYNINFPL